MLQEEFVYELKNKKLVIKKCPYNILSYSLISSIIGNKIVESVIICDGVEKIVTGTFNNCGSLKKVTLPNSLTAIDDRAFENCRKLKQVKLPQNLKHIGSSAFAGCTSLSKINIPLGVVTIEYRAFKDCRKLREVNIEEGVKVIEDFAFIGCSSLRKIQLPSSVNHLGESVFGYCSDLRSIELPEGIEEINGCFHVCDKLKRVVLPSSLKRITNECFANCFSLSKMKLPDNLELIGERAFYKTGLWKIHIPGSVKKIGEDAFQSCDNLFDVYFEEGLKKIGESAFLGCHYLTSIDLPNSVEVIESQAFRMCTNLTNVNLSSNLVSLNDDVFSSCYKLKAIEIPEGVERVELGAFHRCKKLEEIHLPKSLKYFNNDYNSDFNNAPKLKRIFVQCKDGKKEIDLTSKRIIYNDIGKLLLYDVNTKIYSFYNDEEYIEFSEDSLYSNPKVKKMIHEYIDEEDYIKLYYWLNKKIIPSAPVILTMPIKDIDKFFINKNCNEWAKLVKESRITYIENLNSFFKLCYVLGVFSESASTRDKAVDFIRENIIGRLNGEMIHSKFDGFVLDNGFNKDFADFFMKYYDSKDFMLARDEDDEVIDLTCAAYNNFKQVKKIYPNRVLNTNRRADLLLPEHVINAISMIEYEDVEEGNEEFAKAVGRYGYSQEQFDILEDWYNQAKRITQKDMKLFIQNDNHEKGITYELLSKQDPRNAVLGNITNCCQVLGGAGEECVEYGMTKPNSGFITFNYKDKIIAQAWVWYDEKNKIVCLDNIEVPHKYLEKINQNKIIQQSFIDCLLRLEKGFKEEMNKHGLKVEKVTIGKGYNDIKNILNDKFEIEKVSRKLYGYSGYSDASTQYEIKYINKTKKR